MYTFPPHPIIPEDQLCDCEALEFASEDAPVSGRLARIETGALEETLTQRAATNPLIMEYLNNKAEWFNCRCEVHWADDSASCNKGIVACHFMVRYSANNHWRKALCGPCHQIALLKFLTGYKFLYVRSGNSRQDLRSLLRLYSSRLGEAH